MNSSRSAVAPAPEYEIDEKEFNEYPHAHDYDPCREYLRLLVSIAVIILAAGTIFPIYAGVTCYNEHQSNVAAAEPCLTLSSSSSLAVVSCGVIFEVLCLLIFLYACRFECLARKRRYDKPLTCCCKC